MSLDTDRAQLENDILLWDDVQKLLGERVGTYLIARCQEEITLALDEMKVVDPTDYKAVLKLQMRIEQREHFAAWLGDALLAGETAVQTLAQMESEG